MNHSLAIVGSSDSRLATGPIDLFDSCLVCSIYVCNSHCVSFPSLSRLFPCPSARVHFFLCFFFLVQLRFMCIYHWHGGLGWTGCELQCLISLFAPAFYWWFFLAGNTCKAAWVWCGIEL